MAEDNGVGPLMQESTLDTCPVTFHFLPAKRCCAGQLAAAYGENERERQVLRLEALLTGAQAKQHRFTVALHKGKTIALLQLSRDRKHTHRFRIRSLYCRPRFRGRGLATRLLRLGAKSIFELYQGREIVSFVLPTNIASLAAHERAGFCITQPAGPQPENHLCLILRNRPLGRQERAETRQRSGDALERDYQR